MRGNIPLETIARCLGTTHASGARIMFNTAPWVPGAELQFPMADVLVVNAGEAVGLSGATIREVATEVHVGRGPDSAVVTLGAAGAHLLIGAPTTRTVARSSCRSRSGGACRGRLRRPAMLGRSDGGVPVMAAMTRWSRAALPSSLLRQLDVDGDHLHHLSTQDGKMLFRQLLHKLTSLDASCRRGRSPSRYRAPRSCRWRQAGASR